MPFIGSNHNAAVDQANAFGRDPWICDHQHGNCLRAVFRLLVSAGATNMQLVTFLMPVVALLLGWIVLGDGVSPYVYVGMAVISAGLLLIDGRGVRWLIRHPAA